MERVLKNANISILSKFLTIFLLISRNFAKRYLHAKFQINWTIQTEITEGGVGAENLQKSGLFRVNPFVPRCLVPTNYGKRANPPNISSNAEH